MVRNRPDAAPGATQIEHFAHRFRFDRIDFQPFFSAGLDGDGTMAVSRLCAVPVALARILLRRIIFVCDASHTENGRSLDFWSRWLLSHHA